MKKILFLVMWFVTSLIGNAEVLYIYGGSEHDVFLGCLNSSKYDAKSIWNEYGTYGNKYNSTSIWNEYGTYGNPYSNYSPWNTYSTNPPILIDKGGNFYGYFTVNKYKSKRADFDLVQYLYKYYDLIKDDVGKWYDKIFQ